MNKPNSAEDLFLENHSSNKKLNEAVIKQMGGFESFSESAPDISNHGIDGGFSGFVTHSDTVSFVQDNRELILEVLKDDVDQSGWYESVPEMLSNWKSTGGFSQDEIAEALYSNDENHEAHTTVYNAIAWYVGEKVSHEYVSAKDEIKAELSEELSSDSISLRPSDENLSLVDRIENFANTNGYSIKVNTDEESISIEIESKTDRVDVFLDNESVIVYSDDKFGEREIDINVDSSSIDKNIFNAINDGLGFNKDNLYSANMVINGEDIREVDKSFSIALDNFQHYGKGQDLEATLSVFSENMEDREIAYSRKDGEETLTFNKNEFSTQELDFIQSYAESKDIGTNDSLEMGKGVKQESRGMELD